MKFAERNIVSLRNAYADNDRLIENSEHIDFFVGEMMGLVTTSTNLRLAASCQLVFEATPENPELKVSLFREIHENSAVRPWILSNTSSIPIAELAQKAGMEGDVIGFHFYNPPAVQKLLELIPPAGCNENLVDFSTWLASELGKTVVQVKDVAGFAGNGMFIREIGYALGKASKLQQQFSWPGAALMLDTITREYLVRPMGIFQLVDYVGLDICVSIADIMRERLQENLNFDKLKELMDLGIKGGQFSDGRQRDGIFKYENGRPAGVYDTAHGDYLSLDELEANVGQALEKTGNFPRWKALKRDRNAPAVLAEHFRSLFEKQTAGAVMAREYLEFYRELGNKLLGQQVVASEDDLNKVITLGFQHLYGPFNEFV